MLFKVYDTLFQSVNIFFFKVGLFNSAVVFKCTNSRNNNNRVRADSGHTALNIHKLFGTQISTEAGFRYCIVRKFHSKLCSLYTVTAVCNVCERTAVNKARCIFKRLNKVRLYSVLQKCRHCTLCL